MSIILEKMLRRDELARLFRETAESMGQDAAVLDAKDRPIFGAVAFLDEKNGSHPVKLDGEVIGTVVAGPCSKPLAGILAYAARREQERKSVSQDCLSRMNETTLFHDLTGRLCHAEDARELSRLVMEAARRLVGADHVAMFLRDNGNGFITFATNGDVSRKLQAGLAPIVDKVTSSGKAQIIDNLAADPRFNENSAGALACAPLTCRRTVHGALVLLSAQAREYASHDLAHLTTLTSLAALSLDGAQARQRLCAMGPNLKQAAAALQRLAADIPAGQ